MCECSGQKAPDQFGRTAEAEAMAATPLPPWLFESHPTCNESTEIAADWVKWKEKRKKNSTRLKFTRSFPAQGLSKLNKTTQAATYQTACMPGHFYLFPHVCECDRESSQSSAVANIRKTFSMLRIHIFSIIKNITCISDGTTRGKIVMKRVSVCVIRNIKANIFAESYVAWITCFQNSCLFFQSVSDYPADLSLFHWTRCVKGELAGYSVSEWVTVNMVSNRSFGHAGYSTLILCLNRTSLKLLWGSFCLFGWNAENYFYCFLTFLW